jgi:hypothetical protein
MSLVLARRRRRPQNSRRHWSIFAAEPCAITWPVANPGCRADLTWGRRPMETRARPEQVEHIEMVGAPECVWRAGKSTPRMNRGHVLGLDGVTLDPARPGPSSAGNCM